MQCKKYNRVGESKSFYCSQVPYCITEDNYNDTTDVIFIKNTT